MYLSSGDVWDDYNGNGIHDVFEPGTAGVTVELYKTGELTPTLADRPNATRGRRSGFQACRHSLAIRAAGRTAWRIEWPWSKPIRFTPQCKNS